MEELVMKKRLLAVVLASLMAFSVSGNVSAEWKRDDASNWSWSENGSLQVGWKYIEGKWYYFNKDGIMKTGWERITNDWYYFNKEGKMQTSWCLIDGSWYFFSESGKMVSGWLQQEPDKFDPFEDNYWYYLLPDGRMATGWQTIDGTRYYFYKDGKLATNTIVDGYGMDSLGKATLIVRTTSENGQYKSIDELINKWNKEYQRVDTPFGEANFYFEYSENTWAIVPYDYRIFTDWEGFSPYDIENSIKYTKSEKNEMINLLKNIQQNVALDVAQYLPQKKVCGGFCTGFYKYPTLEVDYTIIRFLTWQNYREPISGDPEYADIEQIYNNSYLDRFRWSRYDHYDFLN